MTEPKVQIGDYVLSEAQAAIVRVAVVLLHAEVSDPENREAVGSITDGYRDRCSEIIDIFKKEERK